MFPQHFLPIIYHQGKYVVLDDLHANAGTYDTFSGTVYRDNSLSQLCCPLTKEHGGIHMLIYSWNIERISFTPPPPPTDIRSQSLRLFPQLILVPHLLHCHAMLSQHQSIHQHQTLIQIHHTHHQTEKLWQSHKQSRTLDCKIPFARHCTTTPHTTANWKSSHTPNCTSNTSTPGH